MENNLDWQNEADVTIAKEGRFGRFIDSFRSRRNRLRSSVVAYQRDLSCKYEAERVQRLLALLDEAKNAVNAGRLEEGWKCLQAVQRRELDCMQETELGAEAIALRSEARRAADKLGTWRACAILEILGPKDSVVTPEALSRAAWLRDEASNNAHFKNTYLRNQLVSLMVILLLAVLAFYANSMDEWYAHPEAAGATAAVSEADTEKVDPKEAILAWPAGSRFLLAVILMGIIGGSFSGLLSLASAATKARRIPTQLRDGYVTLLRPALGAAGALIAYIFLSSGILSPGFLSHGILSAATVLAISFVAGFTDRLILRGVKAVTGEDDKDKKADKRDTEEADNAK